MMLLIDYRKTPSSRFFEFVQYRSSLFVYGNISGRLLHKIVYMDVGIIGRVEHFLSNVVHLHQSLEHAVASHYREDGSGTLGNLRHNVLKRRIQAYARVFVSHEVGRVKKRKDGLVRIVGKEFSGLRKSLGINRIALLNSSHAERHRACGD